jgi:hypothetical protein
MLEMNDFPAGISVYHLGACELRRDDAVNTGLLEGHPL